MTQIKICGITREEDALLAAEKGPIFSASFRTSTPRYIEPERAAAIAARIKDGKHVGIVGVFRDASVDYMK